MGKIEVFLASDPFLEHIINHVQKDLLTLLMNEF